MSLTPLGFEYERINFPVGEMHVRLKKMDTALNPGVELNFQKNEDIIELLLVADMMKNLRWPLKFLTMPYVPFGRQDRLTMQSECLTLRLSARADPRPSCLGRVTTFRCAACLVMRLL